MTETGWPLIPREVLPAPVPAAKRKAQQRSGPAREAGRQLPIFGAGTTEPSPGDLVGLLAGPGRLGRMGGTARVSVPVDAAWRVHVLVAELVARGLVVNWRPIEASRTRSDDPEMEQASLDAPAASHRSDESEISDLDDAVMADLEPAEGAVVGSRAAEDGEITSGPEERGGPTTGSAVKSSPTRGRTGTVEDNTAASGPAEDGAATKVPGQGGAPTSGRAEGGAPTSGQAEGSVATSGSAEDGAATSSPAEGPATSSMPEDDAAVSGTAEGSAAGNGDTEAADQEGGGDAAPVPRFEVLTAYSRRLDGLARAWPEAAAQLFLSGPRLRLWVAAAGEPVAGGYALGLDPAKDPTEIDAALTRAGLAGRLSEDGRRYLIMGKRRVARLAELVGDRPAAAPERLWPPGAGA